MKLLTRFIGILPITLSLLASINFTSHTNAQEGPPSLSFGLDQVLFGKGVIDVELLTTIIEEKQDELKKRVIEQSILEPVFKETSFATKNYVFSVMHELLYEKDKNVLKKEVMEQTVNYGVIYTIAEMYVRLSIDSLRTNLDIVNISEDSISISALYLTSDAFLKCRDDELKKNKKKLDAIDFKQVRLNSFLFDCVLQAIIENGTFQEKGFLKNAFYFDLDQYQDFSFSINFDDTTISNVLYRDVKSFVDNIGSWYESFETLRKVFLDKEKTDNLQGFITSLDERLSNATYKIGKITQLEYEISKEEISKLADNEEAILKIRSDYEKVMKNLKDRFKSDYEVQIIDLDNYSLDSVYIEKRKKSTTATIKKIGDDIKSAIKSKDYKWLDGYQRLNNFEALESRIRKHNDTVDSAVLNSFRYYYDLKTDSSLLCYTKTRIDKLNSLLSDVRNDKIVLLETKKKWKDNLLLELETNKRNGHEINVILNILENEITKISSDTILYTNEKYDSLIKQLYQSYYFVKYNPQKAENLDFVNWLRKELIPSMAFLNLKTRGKLTKCILLVEYLSYSLEYQIFAPVFDQFNDSVKRKELNTAFLSIFENPNVSIVESLKFFEKLDQLDKVETYYYLLEQLGVAGEQSGNRNIANAISLITQSIDKYTSYDDHIERIDVDVESIIVTLFERYGERDRNPVNLHVTLGLNNAIPFNNQTLLDGNGDPVRNLGYASEKLGLRFNLYNAKMRYSYLPGETKPFGYWRKKNNTFKAKANYRTQPLISNFHALIYGSGLLYQLTDLGTTKDLKATFVGTGLGLTFYNNLSFNVSAMWPIKYNGDTKFKYAMLNVGFDIYFTEYLTALNKKRKANKEAKLNAEYTLKQHQLSQGQLNSTKNVTKQY